VIPSLASEAGYGTSLVCHGAGVRPGEAEAVEGLLSSISTVKRIREEDFEAGADWTGCAPGMMAAMSRQFAEAGARHSRIGKEEAEEMVISTLYGTAKLLLEGKMRFQDMIERVATRGGITEEGVKALDAGLPAVFDQLFADTLAKYEKVKRMLGRSPGVPDREA
jgi:pyrroline-5-carboxylate reductase